LEVSGELKTQADNPEFSLLKEWAYAGFFFAMSGAVFSHIASGKSLNEIFIKSPDCYPGISGLRKEK